MAIIDFTGSRISKNTVQARPLLTRLHLMRFKMYPIYAKILWLGILTILLPALSFANKTQLNFYVPSGVTTETSRLYLNIIQDFEDEYPSIKIIFHPSNSYKQVLQNVITLNRLNKSAGLAVIEISQLLTLKDEQAIIALDEFIDKEKNGKDIFLKPFIPGFLANSYGNDGKLYGAPLIRSTPIIYYNLDILKKAGIKLAQLPATWHELTATLKIVKAVTHAPPLVLGPVWFDWLFEAFVYQNNGALTSKDNNQVQFNHPATIEALTYWKMLMDKGLMSRYGGSWKSLINGFSQGSFPIVYYSSGGMAKLVEMESKAQLNFKWMVDIMPKNKSYSTPVGAANMFITQHMTSKEKAAAWQLLNYLLRPNIQAQLSLKSGYFPVIKSAFEESILKQRYSLEPFKRARKQLDYSREKIMTRNSVEIRNILKAAINRVLDDGMDPKESLMKAQAEAQQWLN